MERLWDRGATKQLIFDLYGEGQLMLANASLISMVERADFAGFHIREATWRWDQQMREGQGLTIEELFSPTCDVRKTWLDRRFHEIGAHVQACVQSLHSLADILSHALYYGLALNKKFNLSERDITYKAVAKKLALDQSLVALHEIFYSFTEGEFNYLTALDNHGKHRSIVESTVWFHDNTVPKIAVLEFLGFTYAGTCFRGRPILPFLIAEYERINICMIECGIELHKVLQLRKQSLA